MNKAAWFFLGAFSFAIFDLFTLMNLGPSLSTLLLLMGGTGSFLAFLVAYLLAKNKWRKRKRDLEQEVVHLPTECERCQWEIDSPPAFKDSEGLIVCGNCSPPVQTVPTKPSLIEVDP